MCGRSAWLRAWRGVCFIVSVIPCAVPAALHAQVAGYEEGILEVTAERLPALTVLALVDSAGSVLLPLTQTLDYLGIAYTRTDSVLQVSRLDGGATAVNAVTRTIEHARGTLDLTPAQLVLANGEFYLHSAAHEVIVEGDVQLDLSRLNVTIVRNTPFPAQQRIIADERRAMLMLRQRQMEERVRRDTVSYRSYSGPGIADWEIATNSLDPSRLTTMRTHVGVAALGGDLNAGVTVEAGRDAAERTRDFTARYHRVFPRGPHLTQVRLGDILSSGLFARFLRGVEVSNRPFTRQYDLGTVLVRPDLPTGWEYEVLQGNQLLGYSEGAARDPVAVTLRSGTTPLQVRMYGPAGQEVVTTLLYQTPVSLLPAGAFEYAAGAGTCTGGACERLVHGDARWGYSSLVTVGAGFELVEDSMHSRMRPYLLSSFTTGTRATGELTFMPGALYSALFSLFPREGTSARLRTTLSQPGFGPISLLPGDRARWDTEAQWDERLSGSIPLQTIRASAAVSGVSDRTDSWRVSVAGSIRRGYLELRYDHDDLQQEPHMFSGRGTLLTPVRVADRTWLPVLNGGLGINRVGVRVAELGASVQLRPNMNLSAGAQWNRGLARPTFNLAWVAQVGTVHAQLRAVSSARGGTSAAVAGGSVAFAGDGSITHFPTTRLGYAGLHGTVFIDRDGDGVFSAGDEVVPRAAVLAGNIHAVADEEGRFRIWGLQPYEVAAVSIDSTRIADPGLTTLRPALLVRPTPNVARRVDLPLVQTRELIGAITAHEAVATTAGLTLEIIDLETGATTTAVTFSDGQYYVSRVRPGRYRLRVAQTTLDLLRAMPEPASIDFAVSATGEEVVVELPVIHLRPRGMPR